jgi:hypothetical protein
LGSFVELSRDVAEALNDVVVGEISIARVGPSNHLSVACRHGHRRDASCPVTTPNDGEELEGDWNMRRKGTGRYTKVTAITAGAIPLVLLVSGLLINDGSVNVSTTNPKFADQVADEGSRTPADRKTADTKSNPIDESVPTTSTTPETTVVPETAAVPKATVVPRTTVPRTTAVPTTTIPPTTTTPITCAPTAKGGGFAYPIATGSTSLSSPLIGQEFFVDAEDMFVIEGQTTPGATLLLYVGDPSVSPPVNRGDWADVTGFVQPDGSFRIGPNQAQWFGATKFWVEARIDSGSGSTFELVTTEFVGVSTQTCA